MLYSSYGEHDIQRIGYEHLSLIRDMMATDADAAMPERSCAVLNVWLNAAAGRECLAERRGLQRISESGVI